MLNSTILKISNFIRSLEANDFAYLRKLSGGEYVLVVQYAKNLYGKPYGGDIENVEQNVHLTMEFKEVGTDINITDVKIDAIIPKGESSNWKGYKHFEFYAGIGEVSLNKIREEFNRFGQKGELYRTESVPAIAEWSTDSTRETITIAHGWEIANEQTIYTDGEEA